MFLKDLTSFAGGDCSLGARRTAWKYQYGEAVAAKFVDALKLDLTIEISLNRDYESGAGGKRVQVQLVQLGTRRNILSRTHRELPLQSSSLLPKPTNPQ